MDYLAIVCQLIVGFGILNVWGLRFNKHSIYRGGRAKTMQEEFAEYGLPAWSVGVVGFLKIAAAVGLLIGIFLPQTILPSALVLTVLMVVAIAMHLKVKDALVKSFPAACVLLLCLFLAYYSYSLQV